MKSIAIIKFNSPIGIDNGYTNSSQGIQESTMELFYNEGHAWIEWVVDALDIVEHIGIYCQNAPMVLSDYDGVFEMPVEAKKFLQDNGYDVSYVLETEEELKEYNTYITSLG